MNTSILGIKQKVKKIETIKQQIKEFEKLKMTGHLEFQEIDLIDNKIKNLEMQINKGNNKKSFAELDSFLYQFDLDVKLVQNAVFKYLFDKLIVENEITMIAAKASTGKSHTAIGLANHAVENGGKRVVYLDGDNGITTLKDRGIDLLKIKHGEKFRYIHESKASKSQMFSIVDKLTKTDLTGTFIIFDSIKNFITGDRDKNKDVSKTMDILKSLRRQGATVLFLHHTSRPTKDLEELRYAGSSAWEEDTSNAFILKRNAYRNTFIFVPFKARVGDLQEIAFTYCLDTHTLTKVDTDWAKQTQEDEEIKDEIIEFLKNQNEKPNYSQVMQHLQKEGYSRNKANLALQSGKDKHWKEEKLTQNNKSIYSLINKNPKVEYRDVNNNIQKIEKIVKNTCTSNTSRTSSTLGICSYGPAPVQPV